MNMHDIDKFMQANEKNMKFYNYDDYRELLRDLLEAEKKVNRKVSYEYCAQKLGTTKSYLKLLVQKKRHTSQDKIWKLAALFKLPDLQRQFLMFLFLEQTSKEKEIKYYFKQILWGLRDTAVFKERMPELSKSQNNRMLENSSGRTRILYKSWMHMTIYSMVRLHDFKNDPIWIFNRLGNSNITLESITDTLQELIKDAVLLIDNKNNLVQNEIYYREPSLLEPGEYKDFRNFIFKAIEVTEDVDRHRSFCFQGRTLALDMESRRKAIELYQELYAKLLELEKDSKKAESVLMFTNNLFNVTPDKMYLNR